MDFEWTKNACMDLNTHENVPWIEVVKKQKGSPQEDAKNLGTKIGASEFSFGSAWRAGRELKPLLSASWRLTRKKLSYLKEGHSRVGKYALENMLKENMLRMFDVRKEVKWAIYKDDKFITIEKRTV